MPQPVSSLIRLTALALATCALALPAVARPPTVSVSPGYDRRLQESRQAPAPTGVQPPSPSPGPRLPPRSRKANG
ncbi:hypothetical protein [Bradyrhizobium sp. 2TAF24]|uniref:hypothetical protein n=1 Tax=Bradyrhizobium sp. 2TAF24 TaxID=3233011 RepID=UPI003F9002DE